jgi:hypothetical protein
MSPEDAPRTTEGVLASTDVSHHYFLSTETGARQTYPISDNITLSLNGRFRYFCVYAFFNYFKRFLRASYYVFINNAIYLCYFFSYFL